MTIKNAQTTDKSEQVLSDFPLPLGRSQAMQRVHDRIRRLAPTDTTTLIYGDRVQEEAGGYGAAWAEQARIRAPPLR